MTGSLAALLLGLGLGLGAGISPGPLLTLVVTRALQRGFGAGLRVALAPLVTDLPIVTLTLLIVAALPAVVQSVLTVLGGAFVVYLGVETLRSARGATLAKAPTDGAQRDLWRGVLVNLLNPHPWLFWTAVGSPLLLALWHRAPPDAAAFLLGFYSLLVGSKILVAGAVASGRRRLTDRAYQWMLGGAGLLLLALGAGLIAEGFGLRLS